MKKLLLTVLGLSFVGCVNPYAKFYVASVGAFNRTRPSAITMGETPKMFRGDNPDADLQKMLEDGYGPLGYSSFNSADVSVESALEQARSVNADVVICYSEYTNTLSGVVPLTVPNTKSETTNLSGSTFGSGGYGSFHGTANTITTGTQTTYVPYSVNRYDYLATYWVKNEPTILGVHIRGMRAEERKAVGGNKGVSIIAVVKNSPAYRADFFKGDILQKIAGADLYEVSDLLATVEKYQGQKVVIEYNRDGEEFKKTVQLNDGGLNFPPEGSSTNTQKVANNTGQSPAQKTASKRDFVAEPDFFKELAVGS